mmetsp:Transcript_49001/g.81410  ORF Transcript_49001/g.81410 Transcript_49001/m.81410 type:complete len:197 (-) Transcript_49001:428-1018(-)
MQTHVPFSAESPVAAARCKKLHLSRSSAAFKQLSSITQDRKEFQEDNDSAKHHLARWQTHAHYKKTTGVSALADAPLPAAVAPPRKKATYISSTAVGSVQLGSMTQVGAPTMAGGGTRLALTRGALEEAHKCTVRAERFGLSQPGELSGEEQRFAQSHKNCSIRFRSGSDAAGIPNEVSTEEEERRRKRHARFAAP